MQNTTASNDEWIKYRSRSSLFGLICLITLSYVAPTSAEAIDMNITGTISASICRITANGGTDVDFGVLRDHEIISNAQVARVRKQYTVDCGSNPPTGLQIGFQGVFDGHTQYSGLNCPLIKTTGNNAGVVGIATVMHVNSSSVCQMSTTPAYIPYTGQFEVMYAAALNVDAGTTTIEEGTFSAAVTLILTQV
ncbi:type 1 fimbria pilin [Buttiauxella sp. JUb87]|uniref:fimbrial protein n=1 Tax=Buttiauxella sp. JUb87 TaxID=2485129 RepID=UPI00105EC1A4|nr:type 1 fimbrial protein [Buttiauxella sp. JUb87]TDN49465.1 type 1 fimbria pilin [Buttiauxella sp. JUb87]